MNIRKAQTATEYIIIVAVVIVIALVVVQIMGGFPGIGSSTSKKVSDYKLSSSDQIGISKYYFSNDSALATLNNNYFETLRVENLTINGIICNSSNTNISGTNSVGLPLTLNPGQSVTINCSSSNFSTSRNDVTPQVSITYTNPTTGATYTSTLGSITASLNSAPENQTQNNSGLSVTDLRLGLVAYYTLDGNTSDDSGNNNHGTNNAANYTSSGIVGGAYSFNGVNSCINVPYSSNLNLSNFTVQFWIKPLSFATAINPLRRGSLSNFECETAAGGSTLACYVYDGGWKNVAVTLTLNQWQLISFTRNGTQLKIYKDTIDTQTRSDIGTLILDTENLSVGCDGPAGSQSINGSMDEVGIWNRVLSPTEINFSYNNGTGQSLSLGGAYAPNCTVGQTSCSGTNFLNCSNGNWVNNGNVGGLCGYVDMSALRSGLVAYYALDGNTSDSSGNNIHGNNSGAIYTALGKVGGAYTFNGANTLINLSNNSAFNFERNNNFSVIAWVKTSGSSNWEEIFSKNIYSGAYRGWVLEKENTNNRIQVALINTWNSNVIRVMGSSSIGDNTWHQIAFTYDGSSTASGVKIYKDGVNETITVNYNSLSGTIQNSMSAQISGRDGTNNIFNGNIDEVAIYNRSLSATEISYLYNNGTGLSLSPGGAYAPNCTVGQTSCSGTNFLNCSNGNMVNFGNVSGLCGYVDISVLRTGLVAYYALDGNTTDGSGNNYNGNNNGANYTTSGKVGGAYNFNGAAYITTQNIPELNGASQFTVSSWVKPSAVSDYLQIWSKESSATNYINCGVGALGIGGNDDIYCAVANGGNTYGYTTANILSLNTWINFVVVYNGSESSNANKLKMYANGVPQTVSITGTLPTTTPTNTNNFSIGSLSSANLYKFIGIIDEVSVFNRALSSTEISLIYNNGTGRSLSLGGLQTPVCGVGQTNCSGTSFINCSNGNWVNNGNVSGQCGYVAPNITQLRSGLIGYWPLDINTSDMSGSGNTGANNGATLNTTGGKVGGAYSFNGTSSYINIPLNLNLYTQLSLSVWIKTNAVGGPMQQIFSNDGGNYGRIFFIDNTQYGTMGTAGFGPAYATSPTVGTWEHIVTTWSTGGMTVYRNGAVIASGAGEAASYNDATNINLGRCVYDQVRHYNGSIDEVAIYNRILNSTEVAQLYNYNNGFSLIQ